MLDAASDNLGALPDELRAVLAATPVESAASDALRFVMAHEAEQASPWAGSELCGDGFPVEFAFHALKDTLCWTADPARGLGACDQWTRITAMAQALGDPVSHPVADALPSLNIPLRAGTWISGRHSRNGSFGCKVYTDWDVTPACRAFLPRITLPDRLPNGARPIMRGLGIGPGPGRAELYYALPRASLRHVHHVLCAAGLGARSEAVLAELSTQAKGNVEHALEATGAIVSLAEDAPDAPITATVYLFPRAFQGNDRRTRHWFLQQLKSAGQDTQPYATASAAIAGRVQYTLYHGLIALTVSAKGMGWGLGLRPMPILTKSFH